MKIALLMMTMMALGTFSHPSVAAIAVVKVDGSSTVFPITEAVSEEFQGSERGKTRVTVGISGTGGGFKKFCRGETDIQDASRPISKKEMAECKKQGIEYIELPMAFDAITIVVNPKNTWLTQVTTEELKKMWQPMAQGKVMKWSDINKNWPNKELKLFGAGSDSGTFDYFTEAINGKSRASRGDYTSSEDDNTLVVGVSTEEGALGYIPFAYYGPNQSKLKAVAVVNQKKKAVMPGKDSIVDGSYFPLSRPVFIYINSKVMKQRPEVERFVKFYIKNAPELVEQVKYVPLSSKAYDLANQRVDKNEVGTAFGGENDIGATVEEVLTRKLVK